MIPHAYVAGPISCPGGSTVGTTIQCMRRGTIKIFRVIQLTGSLEGFSYVLYNTTAACQANGSVLGSVLDERLYRISPLLVVASSKDAYTSSEDFPEDGVTNLDMPFEVKDDRDGNALAPSPTNAGQSIVLKIISAGTGAKTFGVGLTILDTMI